MRYTLSMFSYGQLPFEVVLEVLACPVFRHYMFPLQVREPRHKYRFEKPEEINVEKLKK